MTPCFRLHAIGMIGMIVERKNNLKKNKIGHLKIKKYEFERVENSKCLGVILNEDNNNQIDLQERI